MAAVNLGNHDIATAYEAVRSGKSAWVVYLLTATNDLKVQEEGARDGTLEDMQDEFSDGKMQFAFARVTDETTKLQKFVRVNWCGGGVPTFKKSRFNQFAEDVARVITGAHVVIQARAEADVEASHIMKRVAESGGSKYSTHQEAPQKMERPAPVGTNYTPIGRPDIASMTAKAKPEAAPVVGTAWTPRHNELQDIRAKAQQDKQTPSQPSIPSPPAPEPPKPAERPSIPQASRPSMPPSAASEMKEQPKTAYEPPAPVGTNYVPVSVPKAGKLGDRLSAFQQGSNSSSSNTSSGPTSSSGGTGKKLTWSERQAIAKQQREEEENASAAAISSNATRSAVPEPPTAPQAPQPPPIAMEARPSIPSAPPAPPAPTDGAAAGSAQAERDVEQEKEEADVEAERQAEKLQQLKLAEEEANEAAAVPRPPGESATGTGKKARVLYEYAADEENEIDLDEGATVDNIEQIDEGWWSGTYKGKTGLFPANYVELIEDDDSAPSPPEPPRAASPAPAPQAPAAPPAPPAPAVPPAPPAPAMPARQAQPEPQGPRARALYDYTADEDNELSFPEEAEITEIEYSSDDWWTGTYQGARGLFPANYVELIE